MTEARGVLIMIRAEQGNRYINATSTCECAFQADFAGGCM